MILLEYSGTGDVNVFILFSGPFYKMSIFLTQIYMVGNSNSQSSKFFSPLTLDIFLFFRLSTVIIVVFLRTDIQPVWVRLLMA